MGTGYISAGWTCVTVNPLLKVLMPAWCFGLVRRCQCLVPRHILLVTSAQLLQISLEQLGDFVKQKFPAALLDSKGPQEYSILVEHLFLIGDSTEDAVVSCIIS
jgi:hypothetical protein